MKINVLMYLFKMHNLDVLAQDKKKYSVYIALYINPIFINISTIISNNVFGYNFTFLDARVLKKYFKRKKLSYGLWVIINIVCRKIFFTIQTHHMCCTIDTFFWVV